MSRLIHETFFDENTQKDVREEKDPGWSPYNAQISDKALSRTIGYCPLIQGKIQNCLRGHENNDKHKKTNFGKKKQNARFQGIRIFFKFRVVEYHNDTTKLLPLQHQLN